MRNHARKHQLVKAPCPYIFPSGSSGSASTQRDPKGRVLQHYMVDRNMDNWSRFSSSVLISPGGIISIITKTMSLTGINNKLLNMCTFLIFSIYWNIYRPEGLLTFLFFCFSIFSIYWNICWPNGLLIFLLIFWQHPNWMYF